jgi:alkanesulfonate monooxygenase SsuD/methylene tetrahydromethanopterin reductase-like flavin-dependent oxidoreductase (luciferase family)
MKLDLLYEIDVPKPWPDKPHPYGQREAEQQAYREAFEQIRLADTLGFNTIWSVEHHFREGRSHSPCSEAVLGALSQVTQNLRLGFGVTLMPPRFIHPARVAEKVATVDVLSGGRVEWGTGRSTPMEQIAFGVDRERSKEDMFEAIRTVVDLWAAEYYERHDEWLEFPKRMVTPKPVQDPHPPVWMAATSKGSSAQAGENGLGLLSFAIMQPLEKMAEHIADYRKAAENAKPLTSVSQNKVAAYTLVHCADTFDRCVENGIWDSVWWWYQNLAQFTLDWELAHFSQEEKDNLFPLLTKHAEGRLKPQVFNDADMIIVGDPDQCIQKMLRYQELGVEQVICYVQFGSLSHSSIMRTIELLGKHVIPELERNGVKASVHAASDPEAAESEALSRLVD